MTVKHDLHFASDRRLEFYIALLGDDANTQQVYELYEGESITAVMGKIRKDSKRRALKLRWLFRVEKYQLVSIGDNTEATSQVTMGESP